MLFVANFIFLNYKLSSNNVTEYIFSSKYLRLKLLLIHSTTTKYYFLQEIDAHNILCFHKYVQEFWGQ